MAEGTRVLSLDEKLKLLAGDIYDAAFVKNSLQLEHYTPSKQIQNLMDEDEFISLLAYLRNHGVLTFTFREVYTRGRYAPKEGFHSHKIVISQPDIRRLLGLKDAPEPVEDGIKLHPKYSYLIINGKEIPLAKGKLHKSLQYWVCQQCLKKQNMPVEETDIMAKYAPDYDINGRSRAVRDAVYMLNPKIKKVTGIDQLFTYSNGYVVLNSDKLN